MAIQKYPGKPHEYVSAFAAYMPGAVRVLDFGTHNLANPVCLLRAGHTVDGVADKFPAITRYLDEKEVSRWTPLGGEPLSLFPFPDRYHAIIALDAARMMDFKDFTIFSDIARNSLCKKGLLTVSYFPTDEFTIDDAVEQLKRDKFAAMYRSNNGVPRSGLEAGIIFATKRN